jgi:molybdate transport system substrate-binding protein
MPEVRKHSFLITLVLFGLAASAACGGDDDDDASSSATSAAAQAANGEITVSAAASLTEAFTEIGEAFSDANPNATVTFNFGSSGTLATQIEEGAPADTFASADEANMEKVLSAGLVDGEPLVFAQNKLIIVTKPGNPENVAGLADLAALPVVSLCADTVPCGKYAAQVLETAGVTIPVSNVTRGQDVKATLGAVTTGDADAAIVYVSDANTAGDDVDSVAIPDSENAIATYPIATLAESENKETSRAFIDFVTSPDGQATLESYGFLPAP